MTTHTDDPGSPDNDLGDKPANLPEILPPEKKGGGTSADLMQRLLEIEKSRIESADKRTGVMRFFIEKNDEADKRQYDFQIKKLEIDEDSSLRQHKLSLIVLVIGSILLTAFISVLMWFCFAGTEKESLLAQAMLKGLFAALGGYGVISAFKNVLKRAFSNAPES
jgi:hypothetical protein